MISAEPESEPTMVRTPQTEGPPARSTSASSVPWMFLFGLIVGLVATLGGYWLGRAFDSWDPEAPTRPDRPMQRDR